MWNSQEVTQKIRFWINFIIIFSEKTGYAYPDSVVSLGVTDADGHTRDIAVSSEYDVFGNVKTVTDNLGQTAYYTYDAAGNLLKTIDRNQTVLYNEYDGIGRVIRSYNTRDAGET